MSLVISMGRNVGTRAMSAEQWQDFTSEALRYVRQSTSAVYFIGFGTGIYNGTEEESFTVIAADPSWHSLPTLEVNLRYLAKVYGQDSIALTLGSTELLTAYR